MRGRVSLTLVLLTMLLLPPVLVLVVAPAPVQASEGPPQPEVPNRDWGAGCLPLHHQKSPPHPPLHPHNHAHDSGGSAGR